MQININIYIVEWYQCKQAKSCGVLVLISGGRPAWIRSIEDHHHASNIGIYSQDVWMYGYIVDDSSDERSGLLLLLPQCGSSGASSLAFHAFALLCFVPVAVKPIGWLEVYDCV
jgi:hypothetical protein